MKKGKNRKGKKQESSPPPPEDPESAPPRRSQRNKRFGKGGQKIKEQPDELLRQAVEGDGTRTIIDIEADGNCLFRSLSDQLYHDMGAKHKEVREDICDFLEGHKEEFSVFLVLNDSDASDEDAQDFETYLHNMRHDGYWGGNVELVAASRMYRRNITVFSGGLDAFTINHGSAKEAPSAGPDLLVSYHDNDHYNSVRNNQSKNTPPPPIKTFKKYDTDEILVDGPAIPTDSESAASMDVDDDASVHDHDEIPKKAVKKGQCPCGSGKKQRKCCASRKKKAQTKKAEESDDGKDEPDMDGDFRVLHI